MLYIHVCVHAYAYSSLGLAWDSLLGRFIYLFPFCLLVMITPSMGLGGLGIQLLWLGFLQSSQLPGVYLNLLK